MAKPTDEAGAAVMEAPAEVKEQKIEAKPGAIAEEKVYRLSLNDFRPSPTNPRKSFDAEKLKEIGNSMKIRQLHPVVCRRVPGKSGLELIAGETRWRAAGQVGLTHLNASIIEATDVQVLELQLIENIQRKDITALEEARAIQDLMKRGKYNVEQCAARLKLEPRTVYNRLELLKVPAFLLKELENDRLSAAHVALIGKLPKEADQKRALKAALPEAWNGNDRVKVALSLRDLEKWIAAEIYHDLAAAPFKTDDAKLCPAAGACSMCPKRTSAKPLAFPDEKRDCCLDTACFDEKRKAHVMQRVSAGVKPVSKEWYGAPQGALKGDQWKESKSPKAVPAILVDQNNFAREIKIELINTRGATSGSDSKTVSGEKKVKPLAERRKMLQGRRQAWILDELRRKLDCASYKEKTADKLFEFEQFVATHKDKWGVRFLALIACFGIDPADRGDFKTYAQLAGEKVLCPAALQPIAKGMWSELCSVLAEQIQYYDLKSAASREKDAQAVVQLMGEKWDDYVKAAAAALPEPKSWAAEASPAKPAAKKEPGKISGKEIAAKIRAARSGKASKKKK